MRKRLVAADLAKQPAKKRHEHRDLDTCSSTPEEEWFEVAKHRDLIDTFVRFLSWEESVQESCSPRRFWC